MDGFGEGDEYGMLGLAGIKGIQLGLPPVEQRGGLVARYRLIREVIGPAAVGVNIAQVLMEAAREEPARDGEVFVVGRGQAAAVGARVGRADKTGRRTGAELLQLG